MISKSGGDGGGGSGWGAAVRRHRRWCLVVATSMAAVEALKDQAGLCRWDYALRSLYLRVVAAAPAPRLRAPLSNTAVAPPPAEVDIRLRKAHHLATTCSVRADSIRL